MASQITNTDDTIDLRRNERFHLYPDERLKVISILSASVGVLSGFYEGIKVQSLRYLTENSHRLPRNVGGWYFYHKKKNYVMITHGLKTGALHGMKYSALVTGFFGLEYLGDYLRGIDFLNTTVSSTIFFTGYGMFKRLSRVQVMNYGGRGLIFGTLLGLGQDLMRYNRGGDVWYAQL